MLIIIEGQVYATEKEYFFDEFYSKDYSVFVENQEKEMLQKNF